MTHTKKKGSDRGARYDTKISPKITGKEMSCVQMASLDVHYRRTSNRKKKKIGRIPELVTAEQFCMEIVTLPSAFFLPIGLKMANDWQKWTRGRTLDGGRLTLIMTQISVFTAVSLRFITLFFPSHKFC